MGKTAQQYRVPQMRRITRGPDTEALYAAEYTRDTAIRESTVALRVLLASNGLPHDYYRDALPEALFSLLESQDTQAALLACMALQHWYAENRPEAYVTASATFNAWKEAQPKTDQGNQNDR